MPVVRFHDLHGDNITLLDDKTVSYREASFAHGITFSAKPLHPMEIFLIEIERSEGGWSGHLRIGLTQLKPHYIRKLPQYALPDLATFGRTWIYAVTKSHNHAVEQDTGSILGNGEQVQTYNGPISTSLLKPVMANVNRTRSDIAPLFIPFPKSNGDREAEDDILPTDIGSRIGIVYIIKNGRAELHFILNGEDQGPCEKDIPYEDGPLYAVVDVYGTTKQVRIIQLYGGILFLFSDNL